MLAALDDALVRRRSLLEDLHREGTTCYRLLHGATEGVPGLTVDRYGPGLLVQTWRDPLSPEQLPQIADRVADALGERLFPVWNHRVRPIAFERWHPVDPPPAPIGTELGLRYDVRLRHRGADPLLFLDLRVLRRRILAEAQGAVLNLFAYTCGVGICAARAGAEVLNVDFAESALAVGRTNAALNGVEAGFLPSDALAAVRQLAGMPAGRHRPEVPLAARTFELVVLDPPAWSTGRYGAVDVVRDYPSLFKPALLACRPGGVVAATNHVPSVDRDGWLDVLRRCAHKAGRPLASIEVLAPEGDFPTPDGPSPLKIAWCRTA